MIFLIKENKDGKKSIINLAHVKRVDDDHDQNMCWVTYRDGGRDIHSGTAEEFFSNGQLLSFIPDGQTFGDTLRRAEATGEDSEPN